MSNPTMTIPPDTAVPMVQDVTPEVPAPDWHDENPYSDSLVYVPIEELATLLSGGTMSAALLLSGWSRNGNALDAYLLPNGMSAGIRFGSAPEAYLSPYVSDREGFAALLERYRDAQPVSAPPAP